MSTKISRHRMRRLIKGNPWTWNCRSDRGSILRNYFSPIDILRGIVGGNGSLHYLSSIILKINIGIVYRVKGVDKGGDAALRRSGGNSRRRQICIELQWWWGRAFVSWTKDSSQHRRLNHQQSKGSTKCNPSPLWALWGIIRQDTTTADGGWKSIAIRSGF